MAFCSNCGGFMADGDKFCGNCGNVVGAQQATNAAPQQNVQPNFQQNAQPNYQNFQPNYQNPQQPNYQNPQQPNFQPNFQQNYGQGYTQQYIPKGPSPIAVGMEDIGKNLLNFLKKPVETISTLKISEVAGYIMAGILTFILTIFTFWRNLAQPGQISDYYKLGLEFGDYVKYFFIAFFLVVLVLAIIWGVSIILVKFLFKNVEAKVGNLLGVVAFAALPYTVGIFLTTIFGYIDPAVGYVPYFFGVIYTLVLLYKGLASLTNGSETLALYTFPVIFLAVYLIILLYFLIVGEDTKNLFSIGDFIFRGL